MIDTHIHLDAAEFDPDRAEVIARARSVGVAGFCVPAVDRASFARVAALAETTPGVVAAFGLHPCYVDQADEADLDVLDEMLTHTPCVAVGEIGLDFFVPGGDRTRQAEFFAAQLELAQRHALPVILHVRHAVDAVLSHLAKVKLPGGIAHAFNGSRQQADAFICLGFKLGFGGAMTFAGSRRIRHLAAELPLSAIVLETDAPDIPPVWGMGQRNEPENLARYAEALAELRGVDVGAVIEATSNNARRALPGIGQSV